MSINLTLELKQSNKFIQSKILNAFARELDKKLNKRAKVIADKISRLVFDALMDSETYRSLVGGDMRGQMGLVSAANNFEQIFKIWEQNLVVTTTKFRVSQGSVKGGFKIQMIKSSYDDVVSASSAVFVSENGFPVPWLEWLLIAGNKFVVREYHIVTNLSTAQQISSRTGEAVMDKGGAWRVPNRFQGTLNNNFVTQTIATLGPEIQKIMAKELRK